MKELASRFLFALELELLAPQDIGPTPAGPLRAIPIAGGSAEGPRLRGTVLPHAAADWPRTRADGTVAIDVRLTLQTDDAALVFVAYHGFFRGPADLGARLARGERVGRDDYSIRAAFRFETGSPHYAWLNAIVAVGVAERTADGVRYDVFEIL